VQTRGQAEKPNPEPSRDGDRALRPEMFPLERGAATPLLETGGELAAILFLFTKMQDAKPLGFFVLLAELAGGVFGDGVGFARGGGGREYDLVDAAIG